VAELAAATAAAKLALLREFTAFRIASLLLTSFFSNVLETKTTHHRLEMVQKLCVCKSQYARQLGHGHSGWGEGGKGKE
jgi:hypothetical protein